MSWGSLRGWVLCLGGAACQRVPKGMDAACQGVPEGMGAVWRMQGAVGSLRGQMLWWGDAALPERPLRGGCCGWGMQ